MLVGGSHRRGAGAADSVARRRAQAISPRNRIRNGMFDIDTSAF